MNNLKDIHNGMQHSQSIAHVVLSGFQWTIWRIYTTVRYYCTCSTKLFYQDFNEQFEGYTQLLFCLSIIPRGCFIRISMNNLKDIHNYVGSVDDVNELFYQDFNEQFEGYTQQCNRNTSWRWVVLSGFQWTIWRIYTTTFATYSTPYRLFCQDFNGQFEGYTQHEMMGWEKGTGCFIRISMNKMGHNDSNFAAKLQKMHEMYKFLRKYFVIS